MHARPTKSNDEQSRPSGFAVSCGRVLHLLLMLIAPGVPLALWQFYVMERSRQAAEVAKQEELEKSMQELVARIRRGERSEVFERLFDIHPEEESTDR